jgi:hypothetical protein
MEFTERAVEILQATNDGDELAPTHLSLVQAAVNRQLTEHGETAFAELHQNATKAGGYTPPWFHGIEHLTIERMGFVCWNGRQIEHYNLRNFAYTERGKQAAEELAERCRTLENHNIAITPTNVSWDWPEILESRKSELP